jgi:hypothetical protein
VATQHNSSLAIAIAGSGMGNGTSCVVQQPLDMCSPGNKLYKLQCSACECLDVMCCFTHATTVCHPALSSQELEEMRHECTALLRERFQLEQCVRCVEWVHTCAVTSTMLLGRPETCAVQWKSHPVCKGQVRVPLRSTLRLLEHSRPTCSCLELCVVIACETKARHRTQGLCRCCCCCCVWGCRYLAARVRSALGPDVGAAGAGPASASKGALGTAERRAIDRIAPDSLAPVSVMLGGTQGVEGVPSQGWDHHYHVQTNAACIGYD